MTIEEAFWWINERKIGVELMYVVAPFDFPPHPPFTAELFEPADETGDRMTLHIIGSSDSGYEEAIIRAVTEALEP